jgi:DNA gyrase/topoisomerase IV subunit B
LQTKDTLTLRASSFGSKCEMPDAFLKKVANSGVVDLILSFASFKADKELKKGDGAKRQRITGGSSQGGAVRCRARCSAVGQHQRQHYGCCMPTAYCLLPANLNWSANRHLSCKSLPACLPPCLRPAGIPKLEDANDAGGRNSEHCTLILTEGDSAKSLAVAGLSVVGRDRFGVFPLRCGCGRPGVLQ